MSEAGQKISRRRIDRQDVRFSGRPASACDISGRIGSSRPSALFLTLLTNILISTQPYFTKMAVDDFITPKKVDGIWLFALAFFGVFLLRFIFSYTQEVLAQ